VLPHQGISSRCMFSGDPVPVGVCWVQAETGTRGVCVQLPGAAACGLMSWWHLPALVAWRTPLHELCGVGRAGCGCCCATHLWCYSCTVWHRLALFALFWQVAAVGAALCLGYGFRVGPVLWVAALVASPHAHKHGMGTRAMCCALLLASDRTVGSSSAVSSAVCRSISLRQCH
jgi:hypothetical protein